MAEPKPRDSALRPVSRPRLYQKLVERVLAYVSQEGMSASQRLPTERDLAAQLGVSRASVRPSRRGAGGAGNRQRAARRRIYLLRQADPSESVQELIKRRQRLPEILEARDAIEVKITSLAAQRRAAFDLRKLRGNTASAVRAETRHGRGVGTLAESIKGL